MCSGGGGANPSLEKAGSRGGRENSFVCSSNLDIRDFRVKRAENGNFDQLWLKVCSCHMKISQQQGEQSAAKSVDLSILVLFLRFVRRDVTH